MKNQKWKASGMTLENSAQAITFGARKKFKYDEATCQTTP